MKATQAVKIQFEIHRLKIQFVELDFSKLIFQKSSNRGKGLKDHTNIRCLKIIENICIKNYVMVDYDFK